MENIESFDCKRLQTNMHNNFVGILREAVYIHMLVNLQFHTMDIAQNLRTNQYIYIYIYMQREERREKRERMRMRIWYQNVPSDVQSHISKDS